MRYGTVPLEGCRRMPNFKYKASEINGEIVEGTVTAAKKDEVFNTLLDKKLYPIKIEPEGGEVAAAPSKGAKGSIAELSEAVTELANLLNANLPLLNAITEMEELARQVPAGRMAMPDEISRVVLFLASDLNTYLTGKNIIVDGGFVDV